MEFLLVTFFQERDVIIDDVVAGLTNHLITLAPGTYTISLAGPLDFTPEESTVIVQHTAPLEPKEVVFA